MLPCQQVLSVYLDWAPTLLLGHSMASCVKRTKNVVVIILSGMDKIDVDLVTDVHQHRKYTAAEIYIWLKVVPFNSCSQEPLSSNKSNKSSKATKRIFLHMERVIYGFFFFNLDTAELLFPSTDSKDMFKPEHSFSVNPYTKELVCSSPDDKETRWHIGAVCKNVEQRKLAHHDSGNKKTAHSSAWGFFAPQYP